MSKLNSSHNLTLLYLRNTFFRSGKTFVRHVLKRIVSLLSFVVAKEGVKKDKKLSEKASNMDNKQTFVPIYLDALLYSKNLNKITKS